MYCIWFKIPLTLNYSKSIRENASKDECELVKKEKVAWKEDDFEMTEYDNSTDDESLRMIFSSTDQVSKIDGNYFVYFCFFSVELLLRNLLKEV